MFLMDHVKISLAFAVPWFGYIYGHQFKDVLGETKEEAISTVYIV